MSKLRKIYMLRLAGRIFIFVICALIFFFRPDMFDILEGRAFFDRLSPFHLLWSIWVIDMAYQLFPIKKTVALGSQKLFLQRFRPIRDRINYHALSRYLIGTTKAAYKVMLIWILLLGALGWLHYKEYLTDAALFMVSVAFYVCDLICVLFWCPFRLIMKNKCCTTCRIFNWDHLMMFTPMLYVDGFYSDSLLYMSVVVWLLWELCVILYPERFWENSNMALKCSECTDKLCTQYCRKLRPRG